MKPSIYIETSVISYRVARMSRDLIIAGHQQITMEWWDKELPKLEGYISLFVIDELSRGDMDAREKRLELVSPFPLLEVTPKVRELADAYFDAIDLPEKARVDAYHLAVATWHGMDYVASWNCKHIANGRVRMIIDRINGGRNIQSPVICTPEELLEI